MYNEWTEQIKFIAARPLQMVREKIGSATGKRCL